MQELKLSRLISDHMVLQRGKPLKLWGKAEPGARITARIAAAFAEAVTGEDGSWIVKLPVMRQTTKGLTLTVEDDRGGRTEIRDVVVGDVWFCSGQSNMDLMMERVRDRYPEEFRDCEEPLIRTFKIAERAEYRWPLSEPETGEWRSVTADSLPEFSATAYFFAKYYHRAAGVPVGLIHSSLGGSRISCWLSREMLAESTEKEPDGYTQLLREADRYAAGDYLASQEARNLRNAEYWNTALVQDEELSRDMDFAGLPSGELTLPCFFKDISKLSGFSGSIRLKSTFEITPEELAATRKCRRIRLLLGTLTDRDETFINGVKVGETAYQYPPRRYEVPPFILKPGKNDIEIRLIVENGYGRVTPGKVLAVVCEDKTDTVIENNKDREELKGEPLWIKELSGRWSYQVLSDMPVMPETDFVNWHPTGLYNAMVAPCHLSAIRGILWYQGEANTNLPEDYEDLSRRLIRGYRRAWSDERLPFIYVQLPNFTIDLEDETMWPKLREKQRACLSEENTGMVCAIDLGEDNDLHPTGKREVGRRLALTAGALVNGIKEEYTGPVPAGADDIDRDGRAAIILRLSHAAGLCVKKEGDEIKDFIAIDESGERHALRADIEPDERAVVLTAAEGDGGFDIKKAAEIRYIDANTYRGALIYNGAGLPMAPFRLKYKEGEK